MNFTFQEDEGHSDERFREYFEPKQNALWWNTGITEYANLKILGKYMGDDKYIICMLSILLPLPLLLLPDQSICNIEGKFELNQKTLYAIKL